MLSLLDPQLVGKGLQLCKVIRVECVAIFANQKPAVYGLVHCMASKCQARYLRCKGLAGRGLHRGIASAKICSVGVSV